MSDIFVTDTHGLRISITIVTEMHLQTAVHGKEYAPIESFATVSALAFITAVQQLADSRHRAFAIICWAFAS
jgi:hypothetical protein